MQQRQQQHYRPIPDHPPPTHRWGRVKHSPEGEEEDGYCLTPWWRWCRGTPLIFPSATALRALLLLIIWWIFNWFFAHSMAANNKSYNILWSHLRLHLHLRSGVDDTKCATLHQYPGRFYMHECVCVCVCEKNVHRCILLVALLYLNKSNRRCCSDALLQHLN